MGASFSVVNVNPKFTRRVTENIVELRAVRAARVDRPDEVEQPAVFDRAFEDEAVRAEVIEQFRAAARVGLAKGAEP